MPSRGLEPQTPDPKRSALTARPLWQVEEIILKLSQLAAALSCYALSFALLSRKPQEQLQSQMLLDSCPCS